MSRVKRFSSFIILMILLCNIPLSVLAQSKTIITNVIFDGITYENRTEFSFDSIGTVTELALLEDEYYSNTDETLFFTAYCDILNADVQLYDEFGNCRGQMKDDGTDGDITANDNVYSCSILYSADKATRITYFAMCGNSKSNDVTAYFYSMPSENYYQQCEDILTTIAAIESPYENENGFMKDATSAKQAFAAVLEYLTSEFENSRIIKMVVLDNSIEFTLPYGLMIMYEPSFEDCLSSGSVIEPVITVLTVKELSFGFLNRHKVKEAAAYLVDGLVNYSYDSVNDMHDNLDGDEVTLFTVQNQILQPNSVILWVGHGAFSSNVGCAIGTTEKFSETTLETYNTFSYIKNRDYCLSTKGIIFFTPSFVRKYCDLSGSFIYFQCCNSATVGTKDSMFSACVDAGADAFAGTIGETEQAYAYGFLYDVITRMVKTNPETGTLYTLSQAQQYAYNLPYFDVYGSLPAHYPEDYRFKENLDTPPSFGTITGTVVDINNVVIQGATISVMNNSVTASSDVNGEFTLTLPVGNYTLLVEKEGYVSASTDITIMSGETQQHNITLGIEIQPGDYLTLGTYLGEPIVWRCVDIDENGPLMLSDKILCLKAFDAMGENAQYHTDGWIFPVRKPYGSNCWSDSNLRQWLNSADEIVSYSHCPPTAASVKDGYNPYFDEAGFLGSFTQDELSKIKVVTQRMYLNEWETHRAGYLSGGTKELEYRPTKSVVDYSDYFYQNVTDRVFLLAPEQANAVYREFDNYLFEAYPTQAAVAQSNYTNVNLSPKKTYPYLIGLPSNVGASYEHVMALDKTGCLYPRAYEGTYGVRPAFYLMNQSTIEP